MFIWYLLQNIDPKYSEKITFPIKVEFAIEASVYSGHGKLILPVIDGLMFLRGKHGHEPVNNVFIKCTVMQAMAKVSDEILIHRMKNRANA